MFKLLLLPHHDVPDVPNVHNINNWKKYSIEIHSNGKKNRINNLIIENWPFYLIMEDLQHYNINYNRAIEFFFLIIHNSRISRSEILEKTSLYIY